MMWSSHIRLWCRYGSGVLLLEAPCFFLGEGELCGELLIPALQSRRCLEEGHLLSCYILTRLQSYFEIHHSSFFVHLDVGVVTLMRMRRRAVYVQQ